MEKEEVIARRTVGRMQGDHRWRRSAAGGEMQVAAQSREVQLLLGHRLPRRALISATGVECR